MIAKNRSLLTSSSQNEILAEADMNKCSHSRVPLDGDGNDEKCRCACPPVNEKRSSSGPLLDVEETSEKPRPYPGPIPEGGGITRNALPRILCKLAFNIMHCQWRRRLLSFYRPLMRRQERNRSRAHLIRPERKRFPRNMMKPRNPKRHFPAIRNPPGSARLPFQGLQGPTTRSWFNRIRPPLRSSCRLRRRSRAILCRASRACPAS